MKAFTRNSLKVMVGAAATAITLVALAGPAGAGHSPIHGDTPVVSPPTVSPDLPDLRPSLVSQTVDGVTSVYYKVANVGSGYAGSSMLSVRRCGTKWATFTDLIFVPGIAPWTEVRIYLPYRVAEISADATGIIRESREDNNRLRVQFFC